MWYVRIEQGHDDGPAGIYIPKCDAVFYGRKKNLHHKLTASVNSLLKSTEQHDSGVIRFKKSLWI